MGIRDEARALAGRMRENYGDVVAAWTAADRFLSESERLSYAHQLRDMELIIYALERTFDDISGQCGDDETVAAGD